MNLHHYTAGNQPKSPHLFRPEAQHPPSKSALVKLAAGVDPLHATSVGQPPKQRRELVAVAEHAGAGMDPRPGITRDHPPPMSGVHLGWKLIPGRVLW